MNRLDRIRLWLSEKLRPSSIPVVPAVADRDLHTLDHWRQMFGSFPRTIECPEMQLIVYDFEEPVFRGAGRIEMASETDFRFYIHGHANDIKRAIEAMRIARENPFDHLSQFRLFATDYRGNEWACGYTTVDFYTDHDRGWPLSGQLETISTLATGPWVAQSSGVELLVVPPIALPVSERLTQVARIGDVMVRSSSGPGRQTLELLGSRIDFTYEPSDEALWITASSSDTLNHPFLDSWVVEPFRILLGGPVTPRMIARNLGDGTAQVTLLANRSLTEPTAVGLYPPFVFHENRRESFWALYADILQMLARARIFGAHPLTAYFDEIEQALGGSRWVLTMTLANCVEGLASDIMSDADRESEYPEEMLASLKKHVKAWKEDDALRSRVLNSLGMVRNRSVLRFLRDLADRGAVEPEQVDAWNGVRNAVMHGNLVSPWSTEEGELGLNRMLKLVHELARLRIAKG